MKVIHVVEERRKQKLQTVRLQRGEENKSCSFKETTKRPDRMIIMHKISSGKIHHVGALFALSDLRDSTYYFGLILNLLVPRGSLKIMQNKTI